jgi:hypothetical protein
MVAKDIKTWCRLKGPGVVKDNLCVGGIVLVMVATLPFVALLLLMLRGLLALGVVLAVASALIAYVVSPGFRHWFKVQTHQNHHA